MVASTASYNLTNFIKELNMRQLTYNDVFYKSQNTASIFLEACKEYKKVIVVTDHSKIEREPNNAFTVTKYKYIRTGIRLVQYE